MSTTVRVTGSNRNGKQYITVPPTLGKNIRTLYTGIPEAGGEGKAGGGGHRTNCAQATAWVQSRTCGFVGLLSSLGWLQAEGTVGKGQGFEQK